MSAKNGRYIDELGNETWFKNGVFHREDGPAVIEFDGSQIWYTDDEIHREGDEPAVINSNGTQEWWVNGKCHRDNGPAVIYGNGDQEWWYEGVKVSEKIVITIQKMREEIKTLTRELCDPRVQTALLYGDRQTLTSNN